MRSGYSYSHNNWLSGISGMEQWNGIVNGILELALTTFFVGLGYFPLQIFLKDVV